MHPHVRSNKTRLTRKARSKRDTCNSVIRWFPSKTNWYVLMRERVSTDSNFTFARFKPKTSSDLTQRFIFTSVMITNTNHTGITHIDIWYPTIMFACFRVFIVLNQFLIYNIHNQWETGAKWDGHKNRVQSNWRNLNINGAYPSFSNLVYLYPNPACAMINI